MMEFARDRGGVMPRVFGVNHHPEIVDRARQMMLLQQKRERGEVTPEWSEERGLDWFQLGEESFSTGIQRMMRDMNGIYRDRRALWSRDSSPEGYSWIDANDSANNVLSFLRYGDDGSVVACVFNFSGSEHTRYQLGLPHTGTWREILNTDATIYNGAGVGNYGAVEARDEPWHGRPASAVMVLPPMAALWFEPA